MTHTTTINGASIRYDGEKIEFQCRVGSKLKWMVWYREVDGAHFETIWATSPDEALQIAREMRLCLTRDPLAPEYDENVIAAGWSLEDRCAALVWIGDILATKRIAEKFAPAREAAE